MITTPEPSVSVLIYDDERGSAAALKERLSRFAFLDIRMLDNPKAQIEVLEQRRREARERDGEDTDLTTVFDDADILIVDYDLTADPTQAAGPAETGERIAYLARCYSECRYVVALNQFASRAVFDLTLVGHPSSFADLNISASEIDNPALWGEAADGYAPWHWPNLRSAPEAHAKRRDAVRNHGDRQVLELLGLGDSRVANALSRRQLGWLAAARDAHDTTVATAVEPGTRMGLKPRDAFWGDNGFANVAAARLHKWLERLVRPGQDVLVDAPHLVGRFPSLTTSGTDLSTLTKFAMDQAVDQARVKAHRHKADLWTSAPTWIWVTLAEDDRITEVDDPFVAIGDIGAFAEDVSRFLDHDAVRPFVCDFEPFSRRYIADVPPDSPLRGGTHGIDGVVYQPAVALAVA